MRSSPLEAISRAAPTRAAPTTSLNRGAAHRAAVIAPGSAAPDFELPDQERRTVRLSELRGRPVVLFFYPADFTLGCSTETRHFAARGSEFRAFDAQVFGVSRQGSTSHAKFAAACKADFPLLSDTDGTVLAAYGVEGIGGYAKRVTFVLDANGTVVDSYSSRLRPWSHADWALGVLRANAADAGRAR
jgi:peroxiredoxin Q/BCP